MKKILFLLIGLLIGLSISFGQTYNFSKPVLTKIGEYTQVEQKVCENYGLVGNPLLPYYLIKTGLNENQILSSVSVTAVEYYPTENNIKIQYKDSEFTNISNYVPATKNDSIYNLSKYPSNIVQIINKNFTICPVIYYPNKNQAKFIKSITIRKNTSSLKTTLKLAPIIITNPYDLLIITKNDFVTVTNPYVLYKQQQGYYTKLITVESIYSTYIGVDKQEKIRNCIIDYYRNNGIQYVLLIGTSLPSVPSKDVIPHRGMWGNYPYPDGRPEIDIPADIYYSNLDGTWKNINDTCYGLPGSEDLTPEVAIGRIPAVFASDVTDWINKVIKYQDTPVINDILHMSMVGELLNLNMNVYGSMDMENLISSVPIPSKYTFYKLYDSAGKNNVTNDAILNLYNNVGTHIINHLGHSNICWNMNLSCGYYISRSGQQWLFNDGINKTYSIIYSQGCYSGALDMRDGQPQYSAEDPWNLRCVSGEAVSSTNGCVAYICNSRYGFYSNNSTSSSQRFHREFFNSLYNKNITKIGDAFNDAKNTIAPFIPSPMSGTNLRFTYYDLNLWGDPSMDIWTNIPTDIIAIYPTSISYGNTQITINTNTPNARIGLIGSNGILIGRGIADNNGNVTIVFNQSINNISYIDLSIIGHNKNKFTGRININYSQVQGYVTYMNSTNTPLKNVTVRLYNENMENYFETTTDNAGVYKFYNIPPGVYDMRVLSNNIVGGMNSIDAQLIMNHFVGIKKLTGLYLKAADVNGDKYVNTLDALLVSKFFVGEISSFPAGKWVFDEKVLNVNKLNIIISLKGLCYGDVNGTYIPQ
jgi:hypothetical protein